MTAHSAFLQLKGPPDVLCHVLWQRSSALLSSLCSAVPLLLLPLLRIYSGHCCLAATAAVVSLSVAAAPGAPATVGCCFGCNCSPPIDLLLITAVLAYCTGSAVTPSYLLMLAMPQLLVVYPVLFPTSIHVYIFWVVGVTKVCLCFIFVSFSSFFLLLLVLSLQDICYCV